MKMNLMNLSRIKLAMVIGLGSAVLFGVIAYAATPTILGSGSMPYSELVDGPATLTARRLIIPADDPPSAWHYHPGMILAVVGTQANQGSVTIEDGCGTSETYSPGQAFHQLDGRVHRAVNESGLTVEEHNMFIMPTGKPLTRSLPGQLCGPARNVKECRNEGWAKFTFPSSFSNQGECIRYVRQRPQVLVPVAPDPLG